MKWFFMALVVGCTSAHAQLILLHDGFESPAIAGHALNVTGNFAFGAWTGWSPGNGGNAGFVRGPDDGLAPVDGQQMFAFNGGNPSAGGYLETIVAPDFTASADLRLTFSLGRGPVAGQLLHAKVEVFDAGGVHLLEELAIPEQVVGWTRFEFEFVGGGEMRLRFTDISAANQVSDLWLDDVMIEGFSAPGYTTAAVPEPTAWSAIAAALALGVRLSRARLKFARGSSCR